MWLKTVAVVGFAGLRHVAAASKWSDTLSGRSARLLASLALLPEIAAGLLPRLALFPETGAGFAQI